MLKAVIAGYLAAEPRRTADRSLLSSISNFFSIQTADETDSDTNVYLCGFFSYMTTTTAYQNTAVWFVPLRS